MNKKITEGITKKKITKTRSEIKEETKKLYPRLLFNRKRKGLIKHELR
jgi:hypothetical protein